MNTYRPKEFTNLLTLKETAEMLAVSVETLLQWNEYHILQPTITPEGQVGYRKEQLDQFLAIRHSLHVKTPALPQTTSASFDSETGIGIYSPTTSHYSSLPTYEKSFEKGKPSFMSKTLLVGMLLSLTGVLGFMLYTQQGSILSLLGMVEQPNQNSTTTGIDTSTQANPQQVSHNFSLSEENVGEKPNSDTNTLHFEGSNGQTQLSSALSPEKTLKQPSIITQATRVIATSAATIVKSLQQQSNETLPTSLQAKANEFAVLASTTNPSPATTAQSNSFTITGTPLSKPNQISMLTDSSGMSENSQPLPPTQDNNQLIFLALLGLATLYFLRKPQHILIAPAVASPIIADSSQRVLELGQKMDGTVVALFEGKEYKICKPEMYSDSDQFIERLMELTLVEKEIEYDSFTDSRLRLSTPLSRIVTRLNFVGLKRDLFFPRTSKNRVFFRRFITYQDLIMMSLTVSDVMNSLQKMES